MSQTAEQEIARLKAELDDHCKRLVRVQDLLDTAYRTSPLVRSYRDVTVPVFAVQRAMDSP